VRAVAALQDAIANAPGRTVAKLAKNGKGPSRLALLRSYAQSLSGGKAGYAPQSATIQGILGDMYQTFAEDQQTSDSTEADQNRNFEDLIATKQSELILLQEEMKKDEQDKAEAEQMLAEAAQAYDDTEGQLKADIAFFDITKEGCTAKAGEWKTRKTLRAQETEGIAKALEILTSDEARELFGRAIKPGISPTLLQVDAFDASTAPGLKKAYQALKTQAAKSHSIRLAKIAAQIRTAKVGHFDKVLESIDKLVQELGDENQADIEKRDECLAEYQKINSTVKDLDWKVEVNEATIDKVVALIVKLEGDLEVTIKGIEDVKLHIVDMKAERKAENEEFLQAKKDDEEAIVLLSQAKDAISDFYKKNSIELGKLQNFLQQGPEFEKSEDQAPDADFSDKGHRKGESKGVISILSMLIEDLGAEITEAQKAEEAAQLQFEAELKAAEGLQAKLEEKKTNLAVAIADRKTEKTDEEAKKADNEKAREAEETYRKDIQPDCDFMIFNFETRAEKRTSEMDGLRQAKEFLAGYQIDALLQARRRPLLAASASLRPVSKITSV